MWLWGLAAALPLLIHLLNRRQYREETWAAMEYLLRAMRKNSRRIQIEQLLLLIIRALILVAAALAWMDLMWSSSRFAGGASGAGNTHTVLVIDGSYSMATQLDDTTRFERARQLASDVVDAASRGDAFTLVLMGEPPRVIIGQPAFEPADVKQELANLTLPHAGADLAPSLAAVEKLLADVRSGHARVTSQRVCLFTDLQSTTWGAFATDGSEGALRRIAQAAPLTLFDVGQDGVENVAVVALTQREPYTAVGRDVTFAVQIKNFGPGDRAQHAVKLLVDDQQVNEKAVDIGAGDEATVIFTHRFATPGEHVVSVQIADDALPIDNTRWLSVPVRASLNVLAIRGTPGAAEHIALALSPKRTSDPLIRVEIAAENALVERDLSTYDAIFVSNVGRFGADEAAVLGDYVRHGGGLVMFLGDQVVAESYNRELGGGELGRGEKGQRLLPATIGELSPDGQYRFDPRDYKHPLVDPFRGHERTGLLTTPTWRYLKLTPAEKSDARVALWFTSGDPAIIEEPIGRGRVVLVATAASPESLDRTTNPPTPWSAFSTWPSFPPLVQEMLALAVSDRFDNRNVAVGQPIGSAVNSTAVGIPLDVKPPDRPPERVRLTLEPGGDSSAWSFAATEISGVYKAEFGEPINTTQLFAVNVDPRESDLARISRDELPPELSREVEAADRDVSSAALAGPRWHLYRWLLGLVLALLVTETWLAWRFGNRA